MSLVCLAPTPPRAAFTASGPCQMVRAPPFGVFRSFYRPAFSEIHRNQLHPLPRGNDELRGYLMETPLGRQRLITSPNNRR